MTDLTDQIVVVTGASAGIGAATARRFAARGAHLVLGARRADRLARLAEELRSGHDVRVEPLALDVRDAASVAAFAERARAFAGGAGPDVLVNNAGLARGRTPLPQAGADDERAWEEMFDVNVLGLLRVTRRLLPAMVARGRGHVINLGSLAGIETYAGGAVYCATKSSVRVLTRALRLELLGTGVRTTCINPGMVETEFSLVRLGSQGAADAVYAGMTPLTADDVADAIVWAAAQPAHVSIEEIQLQPTDQASAEKVHRRASTASA